METAPTDRWMMPKHFSGDDYKVDWYEDEVRMVFEDASEDLLDAAAFTAEGYAKTDPMTPVDTGFMRNAIYAISAMRSGRGQVWKPGKYASKKEGRSVRREQLAPEMKVGAGEAALHAAAGYTIYQEMKHSFIYRALEKTAKQFAGTVKKVGRKHFGD